MRAYGLAQRLSQVSTLPKPPNQENGFDFPLSGRDLTFDEGNDFIEDWAENLDNLITAEAKFSSLDPMLGIINKPRYCD